MSKHQRIIWLGLWFGLTVAGTAHAGLPAPLEQAISQLKTSDATARQLLHNETESALKSGVSEQAITRLAELAARQNYSVAEVAGFVNRIVELKRTALPPELVLDKIQEGMAKRVPAPTILRVASLWSAALAQSGMDVAGMEKKGQTRIDPAQKTALVDAGATLQQVYGVHRALATLENYAEVHGHIERNADSMIAAARLTETLLLYGAPADQALALSGASLQAKYSAQQIQGLQRSVLNQLEHGRPVADIIAAQRNQFAGMAPGSPMPGATPGFNKGGAAPGGFPAAGAGNGGAQTGFGGPPGGGMSGGARPGGFVPGAPGGGFSGMSGRGMSGGGSMGH